MAPLRAAALGFLALTFLTGCGNHGQTVIRTSSPVIALALDGDRVAWSDDRSIHVRRGGSDLRLPLPPGVDTSDYRSGGRLVFAGKRIGWLFERNDGGPLGTFALGVSSASSRTTRFLRADRKGYGEKFLADVAGAVASDGRRLLWTWPRVTVGGPADSVYYCDHYSRQRPCTVRIDEAAIHGWRRGVIPAAAPIATEHGWLAAGVVKTGTFPQARSVGPRLVVVRRLSDGAPVAAVRTRGTVDWLALSHRLLAVQRRGAIDLYALPSGRFLRTVDVHLMWLDGRFLSPLAVHAGDLIVWGRGRIEKIDSETGARTVLVRAPALTAVAVDGKRVAWATASSSGGVIRICSLELPVRASA